jgi:hypothetical protein
VLGRESHEGQQIILGLNEEHPDLGGDLLEHPADGGQTQTGFPDITGGEDLADSGPCRGCVGSWRLSKVRNNASGHAGQSHCASRQDPLT